MKYEGCAPLSYKSYIRPCLKVFIFYLVLDVDNSHAIFIKLNTNSSQMLSDKIYQYILFTVVSFCKGIDCAAQIFLGILWKEVYSRMGGTPFSLL